MKCAESTPIKHEARKITSIKHQSDYNFEGISYMANILDTGFEGIFRNRQILKISSTKMRRTRSRNILLSYFNIMHMRIISHTPMYTRTISRSTK